jgi:hypothetical protein
MIKCSEFQTQDDDMQPTILKSYDELARENFKLSHNYCELVEKHINLTRDFLMLINKCGEIIE